MRLAIACLLVSGCAAGSECPGGEVTWFEDGDGDGFGAEVTGCEVPGTGTVERGGDCDDREATAFPGSTAREIPLDGIDTDCDGNDFCTDLNCDGLPDIVIPSHHDGDYSITQSARLLSGPGGWALDPMPITQSGTLGVAVFDFDQDGYQDIVHASYHDGTTVNTSSFVYSGASDHGASNRVALPTHGAHWVCTGDFDGNGFADLVFANNTDGDPNADSFIYRNRAGAFSPIDRIALPTRGATHCNVDDLDGDGFLDIVFANYHDGSYSTNSFIYWGSAAADYAERTELPTVGAYSSTIADVDNDGRKDIVFWSHYNGTNYLTDENYIYWNRGARFSASDRTALSGMGGFEGQVVDLDNDGHNEVIVAGYHNNGWANVPSTYIYWGDSTNAYSAATRTAIGVKGVLRMLVDDINGDGHKDLLLPSQHDGDSFTPSAIIWGTPGGTYNDANRTELPGYHVHSGAGIADFNHDGFKDVFLPGFHFNMTGADASPWSNIPYSRIYWGSATGLSATFFDEWPTRGAWSAAIVGR